VVRGDAQRVVPVLPVVGLVAGGVVLHQMPHLFAARDEPVDLRLLAGLLRVGGRPEREVDLPFLEVHLLGVSA
jgi:hypothetical protein